VVTSPNGHTTAWHSPLWPRLWIPSGLSLMTSPVALGGEAARDTVTVPPPRSLLLRRWHLGLITLGGISASGFESRQVHELKERMEQALPESVPPQISSLAGSIPARSTIRKE
jgi:hypothetical protein